MKRYWLSAIAVLLAAAPVGAQGRSGIDWNARAPWGVQRNAPPDQQKKDPVRIFDNVWDVGLQTVTPYLVTTSAGLVLFDSTWAETADMVLDNVRKTGFDPKNIKYIIMTHAHIDHFGGAGKMKEAIPGVRVAMSAPDWDFAEQQLKSGARQGSSVPAPLTRDVVIKDGETLKVGDTTFKFYVTPGHTPGSTSVEYGAKDRGKTYRVLSPGGLGMPGPEWTQAYLKSTERLKSLGPWDVVLPNHPGMMIPRDLAAIEKELPVKGQGPHPAVAGAAKINDWFDAILKVTREKLAAEQKASQ